MPSARVEHIRAIHEAGAGLCQRVPTATSTSSVSTPQGQHAAERAGADGGLVVPAERFDRRAEHRPLGRAWPSADALQALPPGAGVGRTSTKRSGAAAASRQHNLTVLSVWCGDQGAIIEPTAPRMLPPITDANRAFYTGGADGKLLIQRCGACGRLARQPSEACAECGGALTPEAVSGEGTVFTFTVNAHQFHPDVAPPNVIAIVVLDEQDDVPDPTSIVGVEPDPAALSIGMPVHALRAP
jgi:uncharacterized OB-fold protein